MQLEITPEELKQYLDSNKKVAILDVRESEELLISALNNSLHIPLMQIPNELDRWKQYSSDAEIRVVICRVGGRSAQAVEYLDQVLGVAHHNLVGGINAYAKQVDTSIQTY